MILCCLAVWWFGFKVTPEEMTDDEGDASISQVETADFGDHSTASGESKRNGHGGRKSNGAEVSHSIILLSIIHQPFIHHSFIIYSYINQHLFLIYFDIYCAIIVQLSSSLYFINILMLYNYHHTSYIIHHSPPTTHHTSKYSLPQTRRMSQHWPHHWQQTKRPQESVNY